MAPTVTFLGSSTVTDSVNAESLAGVTWSTGDRILVIAITGDNTADSTAPAVTGLTFTAPTPTSGTNPSNTGSACKGYFWLSDAAASSSSGTITSSGTGNNSKNLMVWRISGTSGIGSSLTAVGSGLTASLTRSGANSVVMGALGDWNASGDVTVTATPSTAGTVDTAQTSAGQYTVNCWHWDDQGTVGTTSYGVANYTGTARSTIVLVELLASTATTSDTPRFRRAHNGLYLPLNRTIYHG